MAQNLISKHALRDTLYEIGKQKHTLIEILSEFQVQASDLFSRMPATIRPIAFMVSGFCYSPAPRNVCIGLSNFYSANGTLQRQEMGAAGSVIVQAAGCTTAIASKDYSSLRKMLEMENTPAAVLRKVVEIVRRVANDPKSKRLIGLQGNSGVIPCVRDTNITGTYHSSSAVIRAYGPDIVLAVTGCGGAVTGTFLQTQAILSGPPIQKNDECWCGSGKKFKSCHLKKFGSVYARLPMFPKPMQILVAFWKKTPELSGRIYAVGSSFV